MQKSRWLRLWSLSLLCACYNPDLSPGRFSCGGEDPVCPEGQRCVQGKCRSDTGETAACLQPGGFVVGNVRGRDIYACPGVFAKGGAQQQCVNGYRVCGSAEGVNLASCGTNGFFLSRLNGRWDSDRRTVVCAMGGFQDPLGCGDLPRGVKRADCGGFTAYLDCEEDDTFRCGGSLDELSNGFAQNGVLCCPP